MSFKDDLFISQTEKYCNYLLFSAGRAGAESGAWLSHSNTLQKKARKVRRCLKYWQVLKMLIYNMKFYFLGDSNSGRNRRCIYFNSIKQEKFLLGNMNREYQFRTPKTNVGGLSKKESAKTTAKLFLQQTYS